MKTNRFLSTVAFIAAFSVSSIFADTLYLKDGQEIKDAVVTEINDNDVKYKVGGRQVVYTTKKSSIAVIIYDDGTRETFGSGNSASNTMQSEPKEDLPQKESRTRHGILYLKDGQEIKDAVVTETSDSDVKYKVGGRQVVYTTKKSSIAVIIYDDGSRETFGSGNSVGNAVQNEPSVQDNQDMARTRHGIRVAYNVSSTSDVEFGSGLGYSNIDETGSGFEAGWQTSIPISGTITFNSGLNFIYRSPINAYRHVTVCGYSYYGCREVIIDVKATEFAASVPILIQGMPFGGPVFYINGGLQIDFPFNSKAKVEVSSLAASASSSSSFDRTSVDVGVVLGIGWFVGEHLAIDWKLAVVGLTSFDGTGRIIQGALGLNYWL